MLVASPPDGAVLVTDRGRLDRHQLIAEQLAGPCPPGTGDCVPVATVSLLPGGRIGTIELHPRPMLLSNAVLLDLIVCLAARVDACCSASPPARITIDPPALPPGQVGTLYPDVSVTASGGRPPYALEVLSGTVPPGLTAQSPGTGPLVLSGTPIQAGTFTFAVRATDADGVRATRGYTVPVRRPSTEAPMRIRAVEFLARHSIRAGEFETVVVGELRLGEPTVITDNGFFASASTFTEPVELLDPDHGRARRPAAGHRQLPRRQGRPRPADRQALADDPGGDNVPRRPGGRPLANRRVSGQSVRRRRRHAPRGPRGALSSGSTATCRPIPPPTRPPVTARRAAPSPSTSSSATHTDPPRSTLMDLIATSRAGEPRPERFRYHSEQLLTADDMTAEQDYFRRRYAGTTGSCTAGGLPAAWR